MANRITCVVVDCADHEELAAFWGAVLGYEVINRSEDEQDAWVEIGPPGQQPKGPVPTVLFQTVADPTPGKNRVHLDVAGHPDDDQAAEVERLIALGAKHVEVGQSKAPPGEVTWVVLADPEDNEFCVLRPR